MADWTSYRFFLYLLAVLCVSGCAGTGTIVASPTVELTRVELNSASFERQTFLLGFHIDNPNPFPLPIEAVSYRLMFDDEKFASGETAGSISVPAHGASTFSISVEIDFLRSASRISSLLSGAMTDVVSYELQGSLAVDIPFVQPLPFSNSGVINISARDF